MEMIPLDESAAEPPSETPAALEATPAGREPLAVESLENRVLLSAEAAAAPVADAPATEPAPFVAAPQTHHLEIDLQDLAETAEASGGGHAASEVVASGNQSPRAEPHQPEAEKVEYRNENAVEALPERKDSNESEANRNEFGLATIEPPKSKAEAAAARKGHTLRDGPTDKNQPAEAEAGTPVWVNRESTNEPQSAALSSLAGDVAAKLDAGLAKAVNLEAKVGTAAKAESTDHTAVLAQTVLKTEAVSELTSKQPAPETSQDISLSEITAEPPDSSVTAVGENNIADEQQAVESPQAEEYNAQALAETPPEAHDALFAGGQGVEAVLEQSSS